MSNVVALHAFSNNEPLQTIVEAANSDYEPTEPGESRLLQYEDIYHTQVARLGGAEEWQSTTSDSSFRVEEDGSSPTMGARLRSGRVGPRTSSRQVLPPPQESDSSDHASAQRSSRRGSATFSGEDTYTDATSAMQQSLKEDQSDNEEQSITPLDDFDLAAPIKDGNYIHSLETLSDLLFAGDHLKNVFADPSSLLDFTSFLSTCRPQSIPMLMYYLDTTEALKAVNYAITLTESLEPIPGHEFTSVSAKTTMNAELEDKAEKAFNVLVQEDLPAFVTQLYVQSVKSSMVRRIMGPSTRPMREVLEGMLEVFCLTDPSRPDNPIVFASEAFHQMTQYSMNYVIGRNCRFLQGPKTSKPSVERIRQAQEEGRDHCDLILNYRRDGSPFINLLMLAPLRDINGNIRYVLGAQIDVSNLVPDSANLAGAASRKTTQVGFMSATGTPENANKKEDLRDLSEMLDLQDRGKIQKWRASTMQEHLDEEARSTTNEWRRPGGLLRDQSFDSLRDNDLGGWVNSRLSGFYQNYLVIRPYPSLRVLFASQSLRIPGILQSPILEKIEASSKVRDELSQALAQGRSVTAMVRWVTKPGDRGRNRWIAFTPLVGSHKQIGVWIAVLVDDELEDHERSRQAPPVKFRAGAANRRPAPKKPAPPPPEKPSVAPITPKFADTTNEKHLVVPDRPVPPPKEPAVSPAQSIGTDRPATSIDSETDGSYETLEERLRKKRERDAARLLRQPDAFVKPTYKSLSPYAFMNNDGP